MRKVIFVLSILAAVAFGILDATYDFGPKPDAVYDMANKHIEWHYAGN